MEITFLGTSGSLPTKKRNQPAIHLKFQDKSILWDCGEGTQRQITKTNISPFKIDEIYISHLHPDHFIGLWGLIRTLEFQGREKELNLYGPKNLERYVDMFKGGSHIQLNFPINTHRIEAGVIHEEEHYKIEAFPVEHCSDCYGFIFKEKPGINLDKDKLKEAGLLNHPKCSELKEKDEITHNGEKITLEEMKEPEKEGIKIVYTGDSPPSPSLEGNVENADILIADSTFGPGKKDMAEEYKHGEATGMAEIAKKANVDRLILTHFSNRYDDESVLEEKAKDIFEDTVAAKDLMKIEIEK